VKKIIIEFLPPLVSLVFFYSITNTSLSIFNWFPASFHNKFLRTLFPEWVFVIAVDILIALILFKITKFVLSQLDENIGTPDKT
tara:strand:+ start:150 stop:401 length:252 start_codon:yes stop_codon:yes gene_type:complete